MIRNLKVLFAAAMALAALGAVASSAQAADEFHCEITNCRLTTLTDGTGKTAHHVFEVHSLDTKENVSFTCESLRGEAFSAVQTPADVTLTFPAPTAAYDGCLINGSAGIEVHMNGCEYTFTASGGTTDVANVHVLCPVGKVIEVKIPAIGCTFSIAAQTPGNGIGYKSEGLGKERVVTVTANVHGIVVTRSAGCESLIKATTLEGTYTTGNTIVTGESNDGLKTMAGLWYE